jgi:hypothetical protein
MADDWESGFRIGEAFHSWGTHFETVAPGRVKRGYSLAELPCPSAYGFRTVYAAPTAARPDRPVTSVVYELADTGSPSKYIFAQLVIRLGQPHEVSRSEAPEHANACDSVVLHAGWRRATITIGLSLYGAPRPSNFGDGLGKLYLSWADADAAAAPFLAEWTAASEAAAEAAAGARSRIFSVQHPIYEADRPIPKPRDLALSTPELLHTPPSIAARLKSTNFALWSDAAGTRWYLSTGHSTVALGWPETSTLKYLEIAPARGGGYASLDAGSWWVRDAYRSAGIAEAVLALEKVPGLKIERHSGHDA